MTVHWPCTFFPSHIICLLRGATISSTGHSFSLLMEMWKQIGMVPGCQPDSLASQPLLFGRFRAQWQIKLLGEREVYREPVLSQMVSLFYDHYTVQSIFTWQRYVQAEKPKISKLNSVLKKCHLPHEGLPFKADPNLYRCCLLPIEKLMHTNMTSDET